MKTERTPFYTIYFKTLLTSILQLCLLYAKYAYKTQFVEGNDWRKRFQIFGRLCTIKRDYIGKGIIEDLYDCESTLMYLPKTLTTFRVDSFQFRNTGISNSSSNNDSNKKNIKYKTAFDFSRIRKLVFRQYFPSADQELLYIMNRYTGLDILKIGELSFVSWPSPTFGKSAMKAFLKWVFDLKRCDIRILGVSDENWLMNLRSSFRGDLGA